MASINKVKHKKGFKDIWIFLFGLLFGFIFTIAGLVGVGFWAYNNLTIKKVEKLTNNDFGLPAEINTLTLKTLVGNAMEIEDNIDTYTIEDLENDFDIVVIGEDGLIPNSLYGLDLTSLRKSNKNTIESDIEKIIESASLNTFISYMDKSDEELGIFATIINTKVDYYFNSVDNKLYTNSDYSTLVGFDYKVENNNIKIGSNSTTYAIENGKISVPFRTVPIEQAFTKFDSVTNNLKLYEILDYTKDGDKYYTDETKTNEITGVLKTLADKTIKEISNEDTFNNLYIYEVLDYTPTSDGYKQADGTTVTGVIKHLAGSTVKNLSTTIQNLTVGQALDIELADATGIVKTLHGEKLTNLSSRLAPNNLYIYEAMGYTKDENKYYTDSTKSTEITGIMATLAGSKVNEIEDAIDTVKVKDVLDENTSIAKLLNPNNSNPSYSWKDSKENDVTKTYNELTINDLSYAITARMQTATLNDLQTAGIISTTANLTKYLGTKQLGEFTITELLTALDAYTTHSI